MMVMLSLSLSLSSRDEVELELEEIGDVLCCVLFSTINVILEER